MANRVRYSEASLTVLEEKTTTGPYEFEGGRGAASSPPLKNFSAPSATASESWYRG